MHQLVTYHRVSDTMDVAVQRHIHGKKLGSHLAARHLGVGYEAGIQSGR